jgi:hypothetical protein
MDTLEIDDEAPYGRKPNGEPYKYSPAQRERANRYYTKNKDKCRTRNDKWRTENYERVKELSRLYSLRKRLELAYYKQLVFESIESI